MNRAIAVLLSVAAGVHVGAVRAEEPQPVAKVTYDEATCSKQIRQMNRVVEYWYPGVLNPPNYIMYKNSIIPYWEFIGDMHYHGCPKGELPADKAAAAQWYQSAAVAHVPSAQFKLGRMMVEGDGIEQNDSAGQAWITSAALEGSAAAAEYLAKHGVAVPSPVTPNSYTVAARQAKAVLEAGQAADRAAVVRDLSSLLLTAATVYVAAEAASAARPSRPVVAAAPPTPVKAAAPVQRAPTMTKPVYCTYYGTGYGSEVTNTVTIRVQQFCQ